MVHYPFHIGPFDESVKKLKSYGAKIASIPQYLDKIVNKKILQDPHEDYVRTKESFVYVPALVIKHPQIPNPEKPGGVWFNVNSVIPYFAEEATSKHKGGLKFRLNGQTKKSLEGAINHPTNTSTTVSKKLEERNILQNAAIVQNLPVDSMEKYRIFQTIFGEDVLKYKEILDSLGIQNINLEFYNKDIINSAGYCFADQTLVFLDQKNKNLKIDGMSQSLHKNLRTLGIIEHQNP